MGIRRAHITARDRTTAIHKVLIMDKVVTTATRKVATILKAVIAHTDTHKEATVVIRKEAIAVGMGTHKDHMQ